MAENDLIPLNQIRVVSVTPVLTETFKDKTDYLAIAFSLGSLPFQFVVQVSKSHFADSDIVCIAQHFLHVQADGLARSTSEWCLSEEDFQELVERGKARPNKDLGIPPS